MNEQNWRASFRVETEESKLRTQVRFESGIRYLTLSLVQCLMR